MYDSLGVSSNIGSFGLDRQMVPFTGNTCNCQNNCRIGILLYWLIVEESSSELHVLLLYHELIEKEFQSSVNVLCLYHNKALESINL